MGKFSLEKISINQVFNYMIFLCLYKFLKTNKQKKMEFLHEMNLPLSSGSSDNNMDGFGGYYA